MLTVNKTNKPLAYITEGKYKGTIIYYKEKDDSPPKKGINAIENWKDRMTEVIEKKMNTEIITETGKMFPVPTLDMRQCVWISGPSGVGKSYWVAQYVEAYKKMFPNNDVYLFSNVAKDPVLDKLGLTRIPINDDLIDDPIEMSELENSLVIFDDIDSFADKALEKVILKLQADILTTGRHTNTYCLSTDHLGLNFHKTRLNLAESTAFVIYPRGGNVHIMRTMLSKYAGLPREQVDQIVKDDSRWVYVNKSFPKYIVTEKKISLL